MVYNKIRNLPWKGAAMVGGSVLALAIMGYAAYSSMKFSRDVLEMLQNADNSYVSARAIADANKDGVVTEKEWIALYKKHGIPFDKKAIQLRREDLDKIIEEENAEN